ncbi:50S ribosomal protein L35ae [Candidatus Woesearchaeota archaeon]|nr:MAG: 50S ribosomal protein L35ae [Candidatus Woesearchaeota archaeon]
MKGTIVNFRLSRHNQKPNHIIIQVEGVSSRADAEKLVGKKVSWTAPGKKKTTIEGKIQSPHGNSGALRAVFEKGLPGQSLGKTVEIQ